MPRAARTPPASVRVQVDSGEGTLAVNYWWDSAVSRQLGGRMDRSAVWVGGGVRDAEGWQRRERQRLVLAALLPCLPCMPSRHTLSTLLSPPAGITCAACCRGWLSSKRQLPWLRCPVLT